MKKQKIFSLVSVLIGVSIFSGCNNTSNTSGKMTSTTEVQINMETKTEITSSDKKEKIKIRLGAQPASGQIFQFLAQDKGILEEEGVDVEMVYLNNLSDAGSALNAEQVDILSTYSTGGPLVQIANGQDWVIMGGYMIIGETPVYGKPETEFKDLMSLKGKKIGITRGGTPDVVMKGILDNAGVDINKDVTFVEYKKNTDVLQAIAAGEVDFGATATGHQLIAKDLGLEIKMWPDEFWQNHSCCRMFGTSKFIAENPEGLYRLMRAYIRAESLMQNEEEKKHVVDLVVENLDLKKETVETFVLSPHMKYDTDPNKDAVLTMWNKIFEMNYSGLDSKIKEEINIEDHINTKIYERAINSLINDYPDNEFFKEKQRQFKNNNL